MTIRKTLAEKQKDGFTISAVESYDKYEAKPRYSIVISKVDSPIALAVIPVARTTWQKRFKEM